MIVHYNEDNPQILLFEDAELKTTYNMEDLTRQGKGDFIHIIKHITITIMSSSLSPLPSPYILDKSKCSPRHHHDFS